MSSAGGGGPGGDGGRAAARTTQQVAKNNPGVFRRIAELFMLLLASLAAVFFYKTAEEANTERDRMERELRRVRESKLDADGDGKGACAICMTAPLECALQPCGHACTCARCGQRLERCPICRETIKNRTKIFLAT